MSVYKEEKTNTWRVVFRLTDWTGERRQTQKRGFKTKREAQAWEREQLSKVGSELDMTFESFIERYTEDVQPRRKENSTSYSLDQSQVNRTSGLLWSICVPILNDKNEVIAIMALDSDTSKLDIEENKDAVRTLTNTIAVMMKDSVPELFKSEVGF